MNDTLNIVAPNGEVPDVRWNKIPPKEGYGYYDLLYDEELAQQAEVAGTGGAGIDARDSRSRGLIGAGARGRDNSRSRTLSTWK